MTRQQIIEKLLELQRLRERCNDLETDLLRELELETHPDPSDRGHDTVPIALAASTY